MSWIDNVNPLRRLSYKQRSLMTLASSFFIHVAIGAFYVWGGIITYIASSVRQSDPEFTKQDVALLTPFLTLFIMFGTPIGHIISRQKSPRPFLFIFSAALGGIFFASSYLVKEFVWFVFFYGALFGLFTGCIYMVPFISYFPQKRALISGIISSGSALGSIILLLLMFWLINPDNKKPTEYFDGKNYYYDEEIQKNIPPAIRTLGIIVTTTLFICTIFHEKLDTTTQESSSKIVSQDIKPVKQYHQTEENALPFVQATSNESPVEQNFMNKHVLQETEMAGQPVEDKPKHTNEEIENNNENKQSHSQQPHPSNNNEKTNAYGELETLSEGLKTRFIYLTIFFAMSLTVYGSFISSNYKTLNETYRYKDSSGTIIGVVGAFMNATSRVFWGWLFQKYSFKALASASFIMQLIFSLTYMWTAQIEILFILQSIMGFFSFGGWLAILPALVVKIYGNKIGALIYSVTFIGFSFSAFTATGLLLLTKKVLELKNVFAILGLIQLLGLIVVQKYGHQEKYIKKIQIQKGDAQTTKMN